MLSENRIFPRTTRPPAVSVSYDSEQNWSFKCQTSGRRQVTSRYVRGTVGGGGTLKNTVKSEIFLQLVEEHADRHSFRERVPLNKSEKDESFPSSCCTRVVPETDEREHRIQVESENSGKSGGRAWSLWQFRRRRDTRSVWKNRKKKSQKD